MTVEALAAAVIDACEAEGVDHMVTGAFAYSFYGIPRSTKDVDMVLSLADGDPILTVAKRLSPLVEFDNQVQFDTLTWGKRLVGTAREIPLKVELFELFDDPFVIEQFDRKRRLFSAQIDRSTWLPTPEDVVVQKLHWGIESGVTIENWCARHGTTDRLRDALAGIPPL